MLVTGALRFGYSGRCGGVLRVLLITVTLRCRGVVTGAFLGVRGRQAHTIRVLGTGFVAKSPPLVTCHLLDTLSFPRI